jgi:hypothetical protein
MRLRYHALIELRSPNTGMLEKWNDGMPGWSGLLLHHSMIPPFHNSSFLIHGAFAPGLLHPTSFQRALLESWLAK